MPQPRLSIIAPVYKIQASYLHQCIESLVNQTLRDIEIIMVDDGSPDNCGEICDEYAQADSRIIVIHQENQGVSVARNAGMDAAHGEYIMFVDPDDWLELDCCERVLEVISKQNCDVVYFQRQIENEVKNCVTRFPEVGSFLMNELDLERFRRYVITGSTEGQKYDGNSPWGKIFRKDFLQDNQLRFPVGVKKCQDIIFTMYYRDILERAYYFDYVGYHYRRNSGSICERYNPEMLEIMSSFLREIEKFVVSKHKGEEVYERGLGDWSLRIQPTLGNTLFFHPDHFVTKKQFKEYMRSYYEDPVVKKYIDKSDIKEFTSIKGKVLFVLLTKRYVSLYYYMYAILRRYEILKAKLLKLKATM